MLEYVLRWVAIVIMFGINTIVLYYVLYGTKNKILRILLMSFYLVILVIISLFIIYQMLVRKYI